MAEPAIEWPWLDRVPGAIPGRLGGRAVVGGRGIVVTPQPLAAEAGIGVLRTGGNAVDAAVAASAVLMVTVPMHTGLGGDAMWLVRPPGGPAVAVNASGKSAMQLDPEWARAAAVHDGDRGAWTVTVPGAVAGWADVLARFGTRSLDELLQPAIDVAENGFYVSRYLHAAFAAAESVLRSSAEGTAWFLRDGVPAVHSRLRQPELARSLRVLAETGGAAMYEGELAAAVAAASDVLDEEDLAAHTTRLDEPLALDLGGLELLQSPPNSQGVATLEALRLAAAALGKPFADVDREEDLHVLVEALRAALADRDAVVGDPDVSGDAALKLLGEGYVASRAAAIDPARAAPSWSPGIGRAGVAAATRDGDTANLVTVDESGFAVSLTQSLYYDFGSGIPVPGWGLMLHNRGACFSLDPDGPNAIAPGRRPLHTLAPGMALAGDRVRYVFGCMGGHGQAQTQAQLLCRLATGEDPQEAVGAPRFFADPEVREGVLYLEDRASETLRRGLASRGHPLQVLGPWEEIMGHAQLVAVEPSGSLVGGCDPRTDGHVAVW